MALQYPLSKENFARLDIPNLIINICDYKDRQSDPILRQYQQWCVECLYDQWHRNQWVADAFRPFDVFLNELLTGVHDAFMRHISTETKDKIFSLIVNKIFK